MERDTAGVRFRLALFQAASYEGLPFKERRVLHELAGTLLEQRDGDRPLEALSLHFDRARSWQRSYMYSRSAAERATDRYAYADAVVLYTRSIDAARHTKPPADEVARGLAPAGTGVPPRRTVRGSDLGLPARTSADCEQAVARPHLFRRSRRERAARPQRSLRSGCSGAVCAPSRRETDEWSVTNRIRMLLGCVGVRFNQGKHGRSAPVVRSRRSRRPRPPGTAPV